MTHSRTLRFALLLSKFAPYGDPGKGTREVQHCFARFLWQVAKIARGGIVAHTHSK
jgi:hypothetical protein